MALQKSFEQANGVVANYSKVTEVTLISNETARAQVAVYLNAAARTDNKHPVVYQLYFCPMTLDDLDEEGNNPIKLVYEYLKTLDVYSGSTDV